MITKCQKLYQEQNAQRHEMRKELQRCAQEEMPVGSTVTYTYTYSRGGGPIRRNAIVTGHDGSNVHLKGPSGGIFSKGAEQLTPVDPIVTE